MRRLAVFVSILIFFEGIFAVYDSWRSGEFQLRMLIVQPLWLLISLSAVWAVAEFALKLFAIANATHRLIKLKIWRWEVIEIEEVMPPIKKKERYRRT